MFLKAWVKYPTIIFGTAVAALGIGLFLVPNDIVCGGFSGVATLLNHYLGLPVGTVVLFMNIPVFLLGFRVLGLKFLFDSLCGAFSLSVFIDLWGAVLPSYVGDKMTASLFGGILAGAGFGLVFLCGATTGGVDIVARLVQRKFAYITLGRLVLLLDTVVIALSAFVYGSLENALFGAIAIYTQSALLDRIIYGADKGKVYLINSKKSDEIVGALLNQVHRGATKLYAQGAYGGENENVVLCCVRRNESAQVTSVIKKIDPNAFTISFEAGEIRGKGFKIY